MREGALEGTWARARSRARSWRAGVAAVGAVAGSLALFGAGASAQVQARALQVLPANVPVPAAMARACASPSSVACQSASISAIDRARALEGVRRLRLPAGWAHIPMVGQLLVLADLERTDRGLPGFGGLSAALDRMAAAGAARLTDPTGPPGVSWGANIAVGYPTALQADYAWMYDDGPGSDNASCTGSERSGCWGHRRNILGDYGAHPSMGAAVHGGGDGLAMTQLFAGCPAGSLAFRLPALGRH